MKRKKLEYNLCSKASLMAVEEEDYSTLRALSKSSKNKDLENQDDLLKVVSVLVSTGMNRNDDVFLKDEILPARMTGAHKPVNLEHREKDIVGHMLRTYVTTKEGRVIAENKIEAGETPSSFDITSESVIYKFIFPELAQEIRDKAALGKLFVSVEAWFTDYDYLVGNKIVARNADTAPKLDKLLKIEGGPGEYKGHKLGRVLRNILLGGVGLVEKPANPDSIIKSVANIVEVKVEDLENIVTRNIKGKVEKAVATQKGEDMNRDEIIQEALEIIKATRAHDMEKAERLVEELKQKDKLTAEDVVNTFRQSLSEGEEEETPPDDENAEESEEEEEETPDGAAEETTEEETPPDTEEAEEVEGPSEETEGTVEEKSEETEGSKEEPKKETKEDKKETPKEKPKAEKEKPEQEKEEPKEEESEEIDLDNIDPVDPELGNTEEDEPTLEDRFAAILDKMMPERKKR